MFKIVVLCSFLIAGSYAFSRRIVNGTNAVLGEIPYIVSLQNKGLHLCGGSILDATHVLTAAHCISGMPLTDIQYGIVDRRSSENKIRIIKQVPHQNYINRGGYLNDVAVLTLAEPIKLSKYTQLTVLPKQGEATPAFASSILAGWGYEKSGGTAERFLKRVNLRVYSDVECKRRHSQTHRNYHVCSGVDEGGKGQCSGDSGGPLFAGGKQVGIVSWSVKPCGIKGYPGVFTKVSSYVNWIRKQMTN